MNNRITIIKEDSTVIVDGNAQFGLNLSFLEPNIRVIQWYNTNGEIEYKNGQNATFTNFEPYIQAYNVWNTSYQANTNRPGIYYLKSDWRQVRRYKLNETPNLDLYTTAVPLQNENFQKFQDGMWVVDTIAKSEAQRKAFNNSIYRQVGSKQIEQHDLIRKIVLGINVTANTALLTTIDNDITSLLAQIIQPYSYSDFLKETPPEGL